MFRGRVTGAAGAQGEARHGGDVDDGPRLLGHHAFERGVINVASVAGFTLSAGGTSYSATKHWLNVFTEGLYLELRSSGSPVKVQALCPGFTYSEFHDVIEMDRSAVPKSWWMSADLVVAESLGGLDRGKLFVIPGFRYRWLVRLLSLVPRRLIYWGAIRAGRRLRRD